jgi:hypothetical protein
MMMRCCEDDRYLQRFAWDASFGCSNCYTMGGSKGLLVSWRRGHFSMSKLYTPVLYEYYKCMVGAVGAVKQVCQSSCSSTHRSSINFDYKHNLFVIKSTNSNDNVLLLICKCISFVFMLSRPDKLTSPLLVQS